MSDDRYRYDRSHIQDANSARVRASQLEFSYDKERLKKENRYRVKGQAFPKTINAFNWGACLLTPVWGFFNKTPITYFWIFFAIIPFVGIILSSVFSIYCGIKGNEWAWENNEWQDIDQMHYVQKKWAITGLMVEVVAVFIMVAVSVHHINSIQRAGLL